MCPRAFCGTDVPGARVVEKVAVSVKARGQSGVVSRRRDGPVFPTLERLAELSFDQHRRRLVALLRACMSVLESLFPRDAWCVSLIYRNFSRMHPLIRGFADAYGATAQERNALRADLFREAGVPNRRANRYVDLNFGEVVVLCRQNGWGRISSLPSKLLSRVYNQGWQEKLAARVPFGGVLFDSAGGFCRSRYELIVRNLLIEAGVKAEFNRRYPAANARRARRWTCDAWLAESQCWIEIWQFRCDITQSALTAYGAIGHRCIAYIRTRKRKQRVLARLPHVSLEVTDESHRPRSYASFAAVAVKEIGRVAQLPRQFRDPTWVKSRVKAWSRSGGARPVDDKRAISRLRAAGSELGVYPRSWLSVCESAVNGTPLGLALEQSGAANEPLRGLNRDGHGWSYTGANDGKRHKIADAQCGGSWLMSFARAVHEFGIQARRANRRFSALPPWVKQFVMCGRRVGRTGVAFVYYRGIGRFSHFIAPNLESIPGAPRSVSRSIRRRRAAVAALELIDRLLEIAGGVVLLDRRLGRSRLVARRREAPDTWALIKPSLEEREALARRMCERVGIRT